MRKINGKIITRLIFTAIIAFSFTTAVFSQEKDPYVGSKGCGMCHAPQKKLWMEHGHSKMLTPINGAAPEGVEVTPPEGMEWKDISYLVGGTTYYARFIDMKGYVVTGQKAQWSMVGKTLTPFFPEKAPGTMKYECVKCHTTGWSDMAKYEKGVFNTLEGIPGQWFENSVGCETCHGPGHEHAALKNKKQVKEEKGDLKIIAHKKSEMCGECHKRSQENKILTASDNLIMSRQQYTEMLYNKKAKFKLTCVSCHEPHAKSSSETGIARKCEDCHKGKFKMEIKLTAMADLSCTDCHMPKAAVGAYDTMVNGYHSGDTISHIFGITVDPAYKLDDGSGNVTINQDGFARLTVDMTCGACHKSGKAHDMTREQMLEMGAKVH